MTVHWLGLSNSNKKIDKSPKKNWLQLVNQFTVKATLSLWGDLFSFCLIDIVVYGESKTFDWGYKKTSVDQLRKSYISSVSFSHIVNWDSFLILCHRRYDCFHIVRHYGICFSTFNSLLVFLLYWVDLNVWFCWDFLPFLSRFFSVFFSFTLLTFWMLCDYLEDYREILQIWFRKKENLMLF